MTQPPDGRDQTHVGTQRRGGPLFDGGPLVDVPFAMGTAAMALGRFTTGELAHAVGGDEAEARAWLLGQGEAFAVTTETDLIEGGTRETWQRTPEARAAFEVTAASLSPREFHRRIHGDWNRSIDRLESLDHADEYLRMAQGSSSGTRDECVAWAGAWLASARFALRSHLEVGSEVAEALPRRLAEMEALHATFAVTAEEPGVG